VSTWFANARRRLKKENKMTWEPRNKTSEGEDRDSSSPRDVKSDDTADDCGDSNLPVVRNKRVCPIKYLSVQSEARETCLANLAENGAVFYSNPGNVNDLSGAI
ncbi:hypothetical protein NPIL_363261, partial [Nephila pilipes]